MDFFEMRVFSGGGELKTLKICKQKMPIYRYSEINGNTYAPVSSS